MSECLPGCICMCGHEEDIHLDGRCWRAEGPGPMYCGCSDYEPKVHAPGCPNAPKPEPRGAMIVDLEGALKRSLLAPKPEPPPDVAKKHHWTTPDANPDGPIICRYCEVMMTKETESGECEDKSPDVASETSYPWFKGEIDKALLQHVKESNMSHKGCLVCGLAGDDAHVEAFHRVLKLRYRVEEDAEENSAIRSENAALKAELAQAKQLDPVLVGLQHAALRSQRDEARAEHAKALIELDRSEAEVKKLREERDAAQAEGQKNLCSDCKKTTRIVHVQRATCVLCGRRREEKGGE